MLIKKIKKKMQIIIFAVKKMNQNKIIYYFYF